MSPVQPRPQRDRVRSDFVTNQLGGGSFPIGNWYWARTNPDGSLAESISANGPFLFKCLARRDARKVM